MWVFTPIVGIRGEICITTFRNALRAHYLPHSSKYVTPPSLAVVRPWFATIGYNGQIRAKGTLKMSFLPPWVEVDFARLIWEDIIHKPNKKTREKVVPYPSVHNWALKPNQTEGLPITDHMLAICNAEVPRTAQTKGELIKKDKGKEAMSSKDVKEEETKSESEDDHANPVNSMFETSKQKKLKKFSFITEGGEQIHFYAEKIEEQKSIEESHKAELAIQEVEKVKNELVDLMGIDVVTQYYNKLMYDKYCDKMLKRKKSSRITNCDVLTKRALSH
ncbi:hypothetical protein Tco_0179347 [Tanacetum coccineum]